MTAITGVAFCLRRSLVICLRNSEGNGFISEGLLGVVGIEAWK